MRKKDNKNHLFFHDLINHIHGMLLFLNYRMENKEGFDTFDCKKLIKELQMLQSLVQDHFGLTHKNLSFNHPYADISLVKKGIESMMANFLPEKSCKIVFTGNYQGKIHYIAFYRIIGNIIKNMAESQAQKMNIVFKTTKNGLHFTTKNKMNLSKEEMDFKAGVGLLSVGDICRETGGEFHFFKERNFWINEVFLPWCFSDNKPKLY